MIAKYRALKDREIVEPVGFRPPGLDLAPPREPPAGYFITCWACGLSYGTSRLKGVKGYTCGHVALASGKDLSQIARVVLNDRVAGSFGDWLTRVNASQERQHLHWSDSGAYVLKCQKCGQSTTHHKKHVFLKAKCGKAAE